MRLRAAILLAALLGASCSAAPARDLRKLVLRDSIYVDSSTLEPFTGRVFRTFPGDPDKVQLEGELRNGLWNGELVVYHPNGHIRYLGTLADGVKCGVWTENKDPEPTKDVYRELKQEIESMGLYPECPEP